MQNGGGQETEADIWLAQLDELWRLRLCEEEHVRDDQEAREIASIRTPMLAPEWSEFGGAFSKGVVAKRRCVDVTPGHRLTLGMYALVLGLNRIRSHYFALTGVVST